MHNLHYVVVKATSHEEAWSEVESYIVDFGNENNWRSICGSVREDNDVKETGDGRYLVAGQTIQNINQSIMEDVNSVTLYGQTGHDFIMSVEKGEKKLSEMTTHEWWSLSKYAEHKYHSINVIDFDVLEDQYKPYMYDEYGVTQCEYGDDGENTMRYVVFVDMHS